MLKRRMLALAATAAMVATSVPMVAMADEEVEKPEKITIMVDGTVFTQANGRAEFEARWEELTGIDLEIIQPDHDAYYDVVGQTMAGGDWPDVIILSSTYYAGYAAEGVLWDMSEAYENSSLMERIEDQSVIDGLRMDGALYGISPTRGNGCVTYVKKAWLDNCGLEAPTNYEEYLNMLNAFTTGDPDGNGVDGDTYAVSAAGLIGGEAPYVNYLPEFYQDAYPSFYKNEEGVWVDGFTEDAMKEALQRLQDAYEAGYIDKESLTNGTKDCRNKFYEDKFGVFTYWAGTWATNLKTNLEANEVDSELIALPAIEETGAYFERVAPTWCITEGCENPEGVFKYFIETMLDGGDMQFLWTYGVEGVHWSTAAEEVLGVTYEEGEFHMLENLETEGTLYTKAHIDPMLAVAPLDYDPKADAIPEESRISTEVFNSTKKQAQLVVSTDEMSMLNGDLTTLKNEIVALVVTNGMTVEEAYEKFEADGGAAWSQEIVDSLNAK
ncbi:MAG: extracellular solute-binding protein [Lachnospiraceae bacterium]|nr:extracellular solute-binding protein [Lachnospiraceae bacterium]